MNVRATLRRFGVAAAAVGAAVIDLPQAHAQSGGNARQTVDSRLAEFGARAQSRLEPAFVSSGVAWPPARYAFLVFKDEDVLELWAANRDGRMRWIKTYLVRAASGKLGPKLREGDLQVPEGIYRIELLNPNSKYHVSLRLDYPNATDRKHAQADGRTNLGGDIMIHGRALSVGCLAMGDEAAEELFLLASKSGLENGRVVIAPVDFRTREVPDDAQDRIAPPWIGDLYKSLREELGRYKHDDAAGQ